MANLPKATTTVEATAGASGGGTDIVCILAASATQADAMPRMFGSADAAHGMHGYSRGVEYASLHAENTGKPFIYCALPIATPGAVGRIDKSGHTGTATIAVAAGASGVLGEHDGAVRIKKGGIVGTDPIVLEYSADGGVSFKSYRLGDALSFTLPYVAVTVTFNSGGTLVTGDTCVTWFGSDPLPDSDGLQAAFENLSAQLKLFRSVMLIGDLATSTEAQAFLDKLNAYETAHERFVYGRASIADKLPGAAMSHDSARMTPNTSLTFDATADTVTRATGSWLTDGFAVGDTVTFVTDDNAITAVIQSLSATVMTLDVGDVLLNETTVLGSCVGYPTLTFANTGETVTRNRGSWATDGFRSGTLVNISGTASNDQTGSLLVTVTDTVLTFAAALIDVDEVVSTNGVTIGGPSKAEWMASAEDEFGAIDGPTARRLDLGAGRGKKLSPFSGWNFRFPVSYAASVREFQHDVHIPTWRKQDGNTGYDLFDTEGNLVEWDDRVDGSAGSAARFTTVRTWGNGPAGAYITLSLARDSDGSILSLTHNMAVTNVACTVVQAITENFIGRTPVLNPDGTMTDDERSTLEAEVNAGLELALLTNRGEGPRASNAVWSASHDDVLNVPDALLTGVVDLNLRGTIHSVDTRVKVRSGGQ